MFSLGLPFSHTVPTLSPMFSHCLTVPHPFSPFIHVFSLCPSVLFKLSSLFCSCLTFSYPCITIFFLCPSPLLSIYFPVLSSCYPVLSFPLPLHPLLSPFNAHALHYVSHFLTLSHPFPIVPFSPHVSTRFCIFPRPGSSNYPLLSHVLSCFHCFSHVLNCSHHVLHAPPFLCSVIPMYPLCLPCSRLCPPPRASHYTPPCPPCFSVVIPLYPCSLLVLTMYFVFFAFLTHSPSLSVVLPFPKFAATLLSQFDHPVIIFSPIGTLPPSFSHVTLLSPLSSVVLTMCSPVLPCSTLLSLVFDVYSLVYHVTPFGIPSLSLSPLVSPFLPCVSPVFSPCLTLVYRCFACSHMFPHVTPCSLLLYHCSPIVITMVSHCLPLPHPSIPLCLLFIARDPRFSPLITLPRPCSPLSHPLSSSIHLSPVFFHVLTYSHMPPPSPFSQIVSPLHQRIITLFSHFITCPPPPRGIPLFPICLTRVYRGFQCSLCFSIDLSCS